MLFYNLLSLFSLEHTLMKFLLFLNGIYYIIYFMDYFKFTNLFGRNLSTNKMILENLETRISALGGYSLDSFQSRIKEYHLIFNFKICNEVE